MINISYLKSSEFYIGLLTGLVLMAIVVIATLKVSQANAWYHPKECYQDCYVTPIPTPTPEATVESTPVPTPTPFTPVVDEEDKCRNLLGVQTVIPQGMAINDKFECQDVIGPKQPGKVLSKTTTLPATGL